MQIETGYNRSHSYNCHEGGAHTAIGIQVRKGISDEGISKFFGAPAIPAEWLDSFGDDVIFFCQIRRKYDGYTLHIERT